MRTECSELKMIETKRLYHHPDNPRKDLGDVTELADSIKKNGIMQNLTVIPISCEDKEAEDQVDANNISLISDFFVLIGNRRLEACLKAGVEQVPCKIVSNISKKEQVAIMLEENMQRNDLTIYEQAQGFQMMLDLGETVNSISEKTGFSKATVYHRVNLAKLDGDLLKGKTDEDGDFQLTLKDLYILEKIKDLDEKNDLLKKATSSENLQWLVNDAIEKHNEKEQEERIIAECERLGIEKAPNGATYSWSSDWDAKIRADIRNPKDVDKLIAKLNKAEDTEGMYYTRYQYSTTMAIVTEHVDVERVLTPQEKAEAEENKKRREAYGEVCDRARGIEEKAYEFVKEYAKGNIGQVKKGTEDDFLKLWKCMVEIGIDVNDDTLVEVANPFDTSYYDLEEKQEEEVRKLIDSYSLMQQMLLGLAVAIDDSYGLTSLITYQELEYKEENGRLWKAILEVIEPLGFSLTPEEKEIIDGTSDLYNHEQK